MWILLSWGDADGAMELQLCLQAEGKWECLAVPETWCPARVVPKRWLKIEDKSKVLELRNGLNNIADKGNTTQL